MRSVQVVLMLAFLPAGAAAAEEVVGYESGLATHMLLAEDRARMAKLPLQDLVDIGRGRYTHLEDDGVMGHWGLDAVKSRQDAAKKPYGLLLKDGVYQTERVIFPDLSTGVTMMKLCDTPYGPEGDELFYFGKACWNADGSLMTWMRSRKASLWGPSAQKGDDTHGVLLTRGDGTRPRIVFKGIPYLRIPICHPTDPNLAYSVSKEGLIELDLQEGVLKRVVKPGLSAWWLKLSPDGKYACSKPYGKNEFWVVELKTGKMWTFPLETRIHDSYRFVPGDTDWIMYWYEGGRFRTEGIVCTNFKTKRTIKSAGVRFDWNHGDVGRYIGVHCSPYITEWNDRTKKWGRLKSLKQFARKYVDHAQNYANPVHAGGYLQHWPDDQLWAYTTRYTQRPWLSEVQCIFAKPFAKGYGRANWFRVCLSNHFKNTDRKGNKTIMLSRPNISFDGTKLLHNSNVFSRSGVYMTVLRKPQPPTGVRALWAGVGNLVTWKAPKYHQEIRGYHVCRSAESGRGFKIITDEPVAGTTYTDRTAAAGAVYFYAVRSVEHSKLESGLSAETSALLNPALRRAQPLRLFVEAERAIAADLKATAPDAIWVNIDGRASDLHYIWQRRADQPGKVTLRINIPRTDDYTVYARVKGREGAAFTVAGQTVEAAATDAWQWVGSPGTVKLAAGKRTITIESSKHGSCLDCFYLSTDANFEPKGRIVATKPEGLALTVASVQGCPKLSWQGPADKRLSHYNLYCSNRPGFGVGRATLIASPDAGEYLDWQTLPGRNYYRVTQVTLDGLESTPSNEVSVQK